MLGRRSRQPRSEKELRDLFSRVHASFFGEERYEYADKVLDEYLERRDNETLERYRAELPEDLR